MSFLEGQRILRIIKSNDISLMLDFEHVQFLCLGADVVVANSAVNRVA